MADWLENIADPDKRMALGRRFESLTDEVFHVVRWSIMVGFVRYLEIAFPSIGFSIARWVLSFFLFGYIASRFLLRPEFQLVPPTAPKWQRGLQSFFNLMFCFVVLVLVLWGIEVLTTNVADYRAIR